MALERARAYEFAEQSLVRGCRRFYESATNLLLRNGYEYTRRISGQYLTPVPGSSQGGGIEEHQFSYELPCVVFMTQVPDDGGTAATIVLSSTSDSMKSFKRNPRKMTPDVFYADRTRFHNSFDLHVEIGKFSLEQILSANRPALSLSLGRGEPNSVIVYGRDLFKDGKFRQGIGGDKAYNEFVELVGLLRDMEANPQSYPSVGPTSQLEKTSA